MPVVFKKLQQSVGTPMWLLYPYKEQSCWLCVKNKATDQLYSGWWSETKH